MYVLMDMEWITNRSGNQWPTQLAALRVDQNWNTVDTFSVLVRPKDASFMNWDHIAFSGWDSSDFMEADFLYPALNTFIRWIQPDDVLCWWTQEPSDLFNMFLKIAGIQDRASSVLCIRKHIYNFLSDREYSVGSPYELCDINNIETPLPMHCSINDVQTMQLLLKGIGFDQTILGSIKKHWEREATGYKGSTTFPLLFDPATNMLHSANCEHLENGVSYLAFSKFTTPIQRHYKPCTCCRDDFLDALWDRNQDIIERSEYNFVYSTRSNIFHRRGCSHYLLAYDLQGTVSYNASIKKGLRPCKHCNPKPAATIPITVKSANKKAKKKVVINSNLTGAERKAIDRFVVAKDERERALKNTHTAEEHDRVMTLTQPGMVFWAAKGHRTFHRRNCTQLNGLNHLKGFARFQDATRAGFAPCRHCKPNKKQDLTLSIPITSRTRDNEDCSTLIDLCTKHCLPFEYDEEFFIMQTMAGKWRINLKLRPVRLEHINLINGHSNTTKYHVQPRLFLSLKDTFDYIMRHDSTLIKEHQVKLDAPALDIV